MNPTLLPSSTEGALQKHRRLMEFKQNHLKGESTEPPEFKERVIHFHQTNHISCHSYKRISTSQQHNQTTINQIV